MINKLTIYKYYILYSLTFLFFFTIYNQIYLQVIPGPVDDLLYLKNAINLMKGDWLGNYDQYTLSKGAGYSIFLALSYLLDISVKNFEYMFYCLVSFYFSYTCKLILKNKKISFIIFFFLVSNPFLFDYQMARIVREGFYASLVILLFSNLLNIFFLKKSSNTYIFLTSISLFFFWITREEQVWFLLSLLLSALLIFILGYLTNNKLKKNDIRFFVPVISKILVITFIFIMCLNFINYKKYGLFINNDFNQGSYLKAYGSLVSIDTKYEKRNPFPKEKRYIAYENSKSFLKLKPFLEGEVGKSWSSLLNGKPHKDLDTTYWTMWALREAIFTAYKIENAQMAENIYQNIYNEISSACSNKIKCKKNKQNLIPNFPIEEYQEIMKIFLKGVKKILFLDFNFSLNTSSPNKNFNDFELIFKSFNKNIASPEKKSFFIKGWYASNLDGKLRIFAKNKKNKIEEVNVNINNEYIHDIRSNLKKSFEKEFKNIHRFEISCNECVYLELVVEKNKATFTIDKSPYGVVYKDENNIIYLDSEKKFNNYLDKRKNFYIGIYNSFREIIKFIIFPLFILGIISIFIRFEISKSFIVIFAVSLIFSRLAMLSIIEELIFVNNLSVLRLYPATPFVFLVVAFGLHFLIENLQAFKKVF